MLSSLPFWFIDLWIVNLRHVCCTRTKTTRFPSDVTHKFKRCFFHIHMLFSLNIKPSYVFLLKTLFVSKHLWEGSAEYFREDEGDAIWRNWNNKNSYPWVFRRNIAMENPPSFLVNTNMVDFHCYVRLLEGRNCIFWEASNCDFHMFFWTPFFVAVAAASNFKTLKLKVTVRFTFVTLTNKCPNVTMKTMKSIQFFKNKSWCRNLFKAATICYKLGWSLSRCNSKKWRFFIPCVRFSACTGVCKEFGNSRGFARSGVHAETWEMGSEMIQNFCQSFLMWCFLFLFVSLTSSHSL